MTGESQFPIDNLLPHRGSMRLLDCVKEMGNDHLRAEGRILSGSPLGGTIEAPSIVGLEIAAQAAAAHRLLQRDHGAVLPSGYLVRVRQLDLLRSGIPLDTNLQIEVWTRGQAPPLFVYEARLSVREETLVCGVLSIYSE